MPRAKRSGQGKAKGALSRYFMGLEGEELVRLEGKSSNSQFDSLEPEELNALFDSLQEWERHLAQLDSKSLRCVDEHFKP